MCSSILKQTDTLSRKKRKLVYIIIQNPENITYLHYSVCNPVLCTKVQGAWPLHQTIKYRRRYGAAVVTTACWKSDGMENEEENEEKRGKLRCGGGAADKIATRQSSRAPACTLAPLASCSDASPVHTHNTHTHLWCSAPPCTLSPSGCFLGAQQPLPGGTPLRWPIRLTPTSRLPHARRRPRGDRAYRVAAGGGMSSSPPQWAQPPRARARGFRRARRARVAAAACQRLRGSSDSGAAAGANGRLSQAG